MIKSIIKHFKKTQSFKEFYTNWITTLKTTLIPHLTQSLTATSSSEPLLLSTHVNLLLSHFTTFFSALDTASNDDVSQLLYPTYRNDLEIPFLWLGDFHPYIFTNLLRSFLDCDDSDENENDNDNGYVLDFPDMGCNNDNVWRNLDGALRYKVEHIECGLRLMVPSIAKRAREAQVKLVGRLAVEWTMRKDGEGLEVSEVASEVMEEMTCIFLDVNRLRKSVVTDIVGALNVYQAAFFLHGLAQFYVGFWDSKLVDQFNKSMLLHLDD